MKASPTNEIPSPGNLHHLRALPPSSSASSVFSIKHTVHHLAESVLEMAEIARASYLWSLYMAQFNAATRGGADTSKHQALLARAVVAITGRWS